MCKCIMILISFIFFRLHCNDVHIMQSYHCSQTFLIIVSNLKYKSQHAIIDDG